VGSLLFLREYSVNDVREPSILWLLQEELQEARAWGKACQALCHKKNLLTDIEAIVAREPQPAMVYGLKRLRDNVAAAKQLLPRLQNLSSRLAEKVTTPLVTLAELEEVRSPPQLFYNIRIHVFFLKLPARLPYFV
jgi:hypothetical protein